MTPRPTAAVEHAEVAHLDGFLALKPKWRHEWENTAHDRAVILVPKFGNHVIGRWLLARMRKPHFRVKLDDVGSFVWRRCDGRHTVADIGAALEEQFGESVTPTYERLGVFFRTLERTRAISWLSETSQA